MPHEFDDRMELLLSADLDEVWKAIATGPGMDAWFMGRTCVDAEGDAMVRADMGGFVQEFDVTEFEPPRRIAYRTRPTRDGSFLALDWMIEARGGGTTWLRSVASGFVGADDWQDEYDALREGGLRYLHNLSQAFGFFAGLPATPINGSFPQAGDGRAVLERFRRALHLPDAVAVGDDVEARPAGLPVISATVDYVTSACLGLRSTDGMYRFFLGMGGMAIVEHHLFSEDVDRADVQQAWQRWLAASFA